jgi:hypothetical protein
MSENPVEPQNSTDILIWMIATQLLAVISLVVWFLLITDPNMIFAGDSGADGLIFVIIYYPLYPIAMIIYSWIAYSSRKISLALILSGLSSAPTVLLYFALIIVKVIDKLT